MVSDFYTTMLLTFKVAAITTIILFLIAIPLSYYLANTKNRFKSIIEALVSMPLVLPPSVLGFYLLMFFSPQNSVGQFLENMFDIRLVFSFEGIIVGSILFSMPFMVHPMQSGFSSLPRSLIDASKTLGIGKLRRLIFILLPNMKPAILTGIVISFAHTVGEFGVVLMIGGSIPAETRMASIAIYDEVESLNYAVAHQYAFTLFIITFSILLIVYAINRKFKTVGLDD